MTDITSNDPPINAPSLGSGGLLSFDEVEARLIEAYGFLRRLPDRERGWLKSRGVAPFWQRYHLTEAEARRLYQIDSDDYHKDALPKMPGLTSAEVGRMEEALSWLSVTVHGDRRLIGLVLGQLQDAARPSYTEVSKMMGGEPEALRKRYDRALATVCRHVNRRNPAFTSVNS